MKILVTGNAGFIGYHTVAALLARGDQVVGLDSVNDYYDPTLKEARLRQLDSAAEKLPGAYTFTRADIADHRAVDACFAAHRFDRVIHLAAQAGVRYSLENPRAYVDSNVLGFTNILEACRRHATPHLTYASTSSVYGGNTHVPYSEHDGCNHPLSFYAATKRANEMMAHTYSHLFGLPTTGLRFFTVYGPWGRPDMAYFMFTKNILEGLPIKVFNHGRHSRDFTYIDDIVTGIVRASDQIATPDPAWQPSAPDPATSAAPYRLFNIGNSAPVQLDEYIRAFEDIIGRKAEWQLMPMQAGDVPDTFADTTELMRAVGYRPATPVQEGVAKFVAWYRQYYSA